ncbi:MAG: hypothetical protein A2W28_09000 [Gammaproteobacteria bacterium RBG_16_51_14]|nr:MAG: hypothetical protein A2W28_09000 [Gammaproteobacteria bacterium RBG_16_51_14]
MDIKKHTDQMVQRAGIGVLIGVIGASCLPSNKWQHRGYAWYSNDLGLVGLRRGHRDGAPCQRKKRTADI